jgi:Bacterial alpha-L-rhamnosidase C-terminal domain
MNKSKSLTTLLLFAALCFGASAQPASPPAQQPEHFEKEIKVKATLDYLVFLPQGYDKILSEWQRNGDQFELHVRIPVGVRATVSVPAQNAADVTENERVLDRAPGVHLRTMAGGRAFLEVGSGDYRFRSRLPSK